MSAVDHPVSVQDLEISANRNPGGFELAGEFGDQNPALTAQQIEYGTASFFVQHGNVLRADRRGAANGLCGSYFLFIAFHFACPRER